MGSLQDLLPASQSAPRCLDHATSIAIMAGGTGIRADRVVLVETPLPWPKPVFEHPALRAVKNAINANPAIKLLATVPSPARAELHDTEVIVFDRLGTGVRHHRYMVSDPNQLLDLGQALASDNEADYASWCTVDEKLTKATILVCTQGSHDVCCGSEGTRFANAMSERFPELTVHRVSHTGGHRFAPTAMTFPDGRMWAYMDQALVEQLLAGGFDQSRCRGWWGAEPGPAQVAEAAVRARQATDFDTTPRTVTTTNTNDSDRFDCLVETPNGSWSVTVALGREVPYIACRASGGIPYKTATEFIVESVAELQS